MSSVLEVRVTGEDYKSFRKAMWLAFRGIGNPQTSRSFLVKGGHDPRMVFYWTEADDEAVRKQKKPNVMGLQHTFDMDAQAAWKFGWSWLKQVKFPPPPDIDGSVHKGWIVTNCFCGYGLAGPDDNSLLVESPFYAIVLVAPYWIEYHK